MKHLTIGAVLVAGTLFCLEGCQLLGPSAINQGRDRYNNVIHRTSNEQILANVVRVYNHEPTLFMDVTEVDATEYIQGSLTGGATGLGGISGLQGAGRPVVTGATSSGPSSSLSSKVVSAAVGSVGGTVAYQESPTIRYQPLLGQALVAQLVSPVSVDALGFLSDSYWDIMPLLDFSSAYLTLDFTKFYSALNTIAELYEAGELEMIPTKSALTKKIKSETGLEQIDAKSGTIIIIGNESKPATSHANDTLTLYLLPYHPFHHGTYTANKARTLQLWIRLLRIYSGTQPPFSRPEGVGCTDIGISDLKLTEWDRNIAKKGDTDLDRARECLPNSIELRTAPLTPEDASQQKSVRQTKKDRNPEKQVKSPNMAAPVLRTYSALGILKNATERPRPKIEFLSRKAYSQIRSHSWNQDLENATFYTLLPGDEDSFNCPDERRQSGGCDNPKGRGDAANIDNAIIDTALAGWISTKTSADDLYVYESDETVDRKIDPTGSMDPDVLVEKNILVNRRLGLLRRYILVIVDEREPDNANAYVEYSENGKWYYIASDDTISQKNFDLVSLFLTMMAIPSQLLPLSPVINVGG